MPIDVRTSAVGSRDVNAQPDRGDRRRKLVPADGSARVLARPGPQTGAPARDPRTHARDFAGAAGTPGARPWPCQPADQIGGAGPRGSDAGHARHGKDAPCPLSLPDRKTTQTSRSTTRITAPASRWY